MTLAEKAAKALAGLGDTPDEIAAMLLGAGYRGEMKEPTECPCGSCLRDHFGEEIRVGFQGIYGASLHKTDLLARNSPQVSAFIEAFDAGKYPELVQPWPYAATSPCATEADLCP